MKIRVKKSTYAQVMAKKRPEHRQPARRSLLLHSVIRLISLPDLWATRFRFRRHRMELVGDSPCLVLMNHSCFLDLEIAFRVLYPKPFHIVCTSDGFVGKNWLMRWLGCIPTQKFVTDLTLVQDLLHTFRELKSSVLMYPEASYSFDGTATPLPRKMGVLLKKLDVPVVVIQTHGAFLRDPLYNGLQKRKVPVSADVTCLFTQQEVRELPVATLTKGLEDAFVFDGFAWQQENNIQISEPFRADGLNRILYRCAACGTEGKMLGKGTGLTCGHCGKHYELTPAGRLETSDGSTEFPHIPDWYAWERSTVREALLDGSYRLDVDVNIGMMVDFKAIYMVGEGHLTHDRNGFVLTGCDGELEYAQSPQSCYGLYSDYFWYEIGDVICIGNNDRLYYCFPKEGSGDVVAKTRLAAEELYKLYKARLLKPESAAVL